nr:spermidine synthase [Amycolatopsis anabasis]
MTTADHSARVSEPLGQGLTRVWDLRKVRWEGDTAFQHLVIADTAQGVSLFCDNDRQSTEFSQLVYHEALLVPALLLADQVRTVLVIGSSEGVACQIAVAAGANQVDHVDIDRDAVKLCAEHLPYGYTPRELAGAERGDGPIRVHYGDGWQFVADARARRDRYDIVLVDLPDERISEDAQHNRLYGTDFLRMCRSVLNPGGVVATQAGCPTLWRNQTLLTSWRRFTETFATTAYFGSDEHEWAYLFGRVDEVADSTALMVERLAGCPYRPVSIDAETLVGSSVPPYHVRHQRPVPSDERSS